MDLPGTGFLELGRHTDEDRLLAARKLHPNSSPSPFHQSGSETAGCPVTLKTGVKGENLKRSRPSRLRGSVREYRSGTGLASVR